MELFKLSITTNNGIGLNASWLLLWLIALGLIIILLIFKKYKKEYSWFEIDQAEIGIGNHKIKIKPNNEDLQIAYQLWVELSTRKIGLEIDKENDVIAELYNSWYEFFKIARELIKSVPVTKVRANTSTQEIINLSFMILNEALRPHLTKWQAKFRRWYEEANEKAENKSKTPQEIQKEYPEYSELMDDLIRVNNILISYKNTLEKLIHV